MDGLLGGLPLHVNCLNAQQQCSEGKTGGTAPWVDASLLAYCKLERYMEVFRVALCLYILPANIKPAMSKGAMAWD